jgi:hypothetical protein
MEQKKYGSQKWLIGLSILIVLAMACSIPSLLSQSSAPADDEEGVEEPVLPAGSEGGEEQASESGERIGSCPTEDQTWFLSYYHDFQVNTGFGPWQARASGNKVVYFNADGSIAVDPTEPIAGAVFTELTDGDNFCSGHAFNELKEGDKFCSGHAFVDIYTSIDATCSNGVVSMTIYEDWQYQEFTMTCDDDTIQFPIPSYGSATHKNLKFPLMANGSSMQTHDFQGGSGTKTWILSYEPPVEPIVDPDELNPDAWNESDE